MNKKPTVSVIIPVYGVEDYIEKCLQSLLNQTFTDFEAIIVDDGSLDQSIPKAKKLVGNDPRFIFLEKENGGQGSARNLALDIAKGNYFIFLDSDDYLEITFIEEMINKIVSEQADIVICGMKWVYPSGEVIKINHEDPNKYYTEQDLCLIKNSVQSYLCNKIFQKNIFTNMRMNEDIIYEDEHLLFRLIYNKKVITIEKCLYNYVQHNKSTVNSYNPKFIPSIHELVNIRKDFLYKNDLYDNAYFIDVYLHYICKTLQYLVSHSPSPIKEATNYKRTLDPDIFNIKNISHSSLSINNKIKLILLKLSPFISINVNKIYRFFSKK